MDKKEERKPANTLFRIAGVAASLAFGAMVGSLFAVKAAPGGVTFELTIGAVVAFLLAAGLAWFYWRLIERMALEKSPELRQRKFILFSAGLLVLGVVSFLYPIQFVPAEKRWDVLVGLFLAVLILSGIGFVLWRIRNFLEADLKRSEDEEQR